MVEAIPAGSGATVTLRTRILLAAAVTLGLGAGSWSYEAWPSWFGQEVVLEANLGLKDARSGRAGIEFPAAHLRLDVPGAQADDLPVPFHHVRAIGPVWPGGSDPVQSARLFHGRVVYVQVEARGPAEAAAPYENRVPVSVSTTPVIGATNLRTRVTRVEPSGRFQITLAPPLLAVPPELPDAASVWAVFKVLPSGRHAIVRLVNR